MGFLQKVENILARPAVITIYKAFARPQFAYGGIIYDEA